MPLCRPKAIKIEGAVNRGSQPEFAQAGVVIGAAPQGQ